MFSPPARALPDSRTAMFSSVREPSAGRLRPARRQVNHARQRGEQRVVRTLVAAEEAAHDRARARAAAAAARRPAAAASSAGRTAPCRARPACPARSTARARRPAGTRSGRPRCRRIGSRRRVSPAGAARDHVVLDHALRAGHHAARDLAATAAPRPPTASSARSRSTPRRSGAPRAARPTARRPITAASSAAGRASMRSGRTGKGFAQTDGLPCESDACAWPHHGLRSVGTCRAMMRAAQSGGQVYDDRYLADVRRRAPRRRRAARATRSPTGSSRAPARSRPSPARSAPRRVADPHPQGRPHDRRRRASRRHHVSAGDPAGAERSPRESRSPA